MQENEQYGSDALTEKEFNELNEQQSDILDSLNEVVAARDEAKQFLNSDFGKAIRNTLAAQKLSTMKMCAETIGTGAEAEANAKLHYEVICKVETIFGHIIVQGDEAIRQLQHMQIGE